MSYSSTLSQIKALNDRINTDSLTSKEYRELIIQRETLWFVHNQQKGLM